MAEKNLCFKELSLSLQVLVFWKLNFFLETYFIAVILWRY